MTDLLSPRARTRSAPGWATAGTAAGMGWNGGFRNLFGHDLSLLAQLELTLRRRHGRDGRDRRRRGARRRPDRAHRQLRRRALRRPRGAGRVVAPGFDDAGWERVAVAPPRPAHARRARGPARAVHGGGRAGRGAHDAERRRVLDFGQNLVGRVRIRVTGASGGSRGDPHRGGAAGGRDLHAAPAHARSPPTSTCSPAARRRGVGAAVHVPRLPLRRGRRVARRPRRRRRERRPRRAGLPHRPRAHRLVRVLRPARRTGCTRTSCGACAATSSTSPPTARSATSASAGRATSRCSRRPRRSSTTCRACSRRGCKDVAVDQLPDGTVPWYVPVIPGAPHVDADPPGRRVGRRRDAHPVDALRALRRRGDPRRAVRQREGAGSSSSSGSPGPTGCGTRASSSATGSTPPPRRRTRPTRAPTATSWRPRTSRVGATASRGWPRCSGRRDDADAVRRARGRGRAPRSRARVRAARRRA